MLSIFQECYFVMILSCELRDILCLLKTWGTYSKLLWLLEAIFYQYAIILNCLFIFILFFINQVNLVSYLL
jgi:hypothetical protein